MSDELKRCPFCGGEAEYVYCGGEGDLHGVAGCTVCDCTLEVGTWNDALVTWNTRTSDDLLAAAKAALGEMIHIASSRKASIGAIDNTYTPQLSVKRVDALIEALQVAITKAEGGEDE